MKKIEKMNKEVPIKTIDLFPKLDLKLIEVLKSLDAQDWERKTLAAKWTIKDVAAHLLDTNVRAISMFRYKYFPKENPEVNSYEDLVKYLNRLNATWVESFKRVSPELIIELLQITSKQYFESLKSLPPFEKAIFSVDWAGEEESQNWFHIAREYTEKWHHQQQIRFAVGKDKELYSKEFHLPYLETSMRALPHHYRSVRGNQNDVIKINVVGDNKCTWTLVWKEVQWELNTAELKSTCEISIPEDIAWRIFTKGIRIEEAIGKSKIEGSTVFGNHFFDMVAVMA